MNNNLTETIRLFRESYNNINQRLNGLRTDLNHLAESNAANGTLINNLEQIRDNHQDQLQAKDNEIRELETNLRTREDELREVRGILSDEREQARRFFEIIHSILRNLSQARENLNQLRNNRNNRDINNNIGITAERIEDLIRFISNLFNI